jgi:hypothetical protein
MTWLIIDHVDAGTSLKDPKGKAFGSIQKMNRVRNAWEMRSDQEPGSDLVHMRFFHAKWNHTGKKRPFGMRMEFGGETVKFYSEEPTTNPQGSSASLADKMAIELSTGRLSTGVLALSLNVTENSVRSELSRHRERFTRDERGYVVLRSELEEALP